MGCDVDVDCGLVWHLPGPSLVVHLNHLRIWADLLRARQLQEASLCASHVDGVLAKRIIPAEAAADFAAADAIVLLYGERRTVSPARVGRRPENPSRRVIHRARRPAPVCGLLVAKRSDSHQCEHAQQGYHTTSQDDWWAGCRYRCDITARSRRRGHAGHRRGRNLRHRHCTVLLRKLVVARTKSTNLRRVECHRFGYSLYGVNLGGAGRTDRF
mmetsp:Transcript_37135/g.94894  ORF Transcript_37135/g.94894 Transcript_37135/m.94894 type:complete len:214 (-) Transcript_37135:63-704(-)